MNKECLYYRNAKGEQLIDNLSDHDINNLEYNNFLPLLIPFIIPAVGIYVIYKGVKYFSNSATGKAVQDGTTGTQVQTDVKQKSPLPYVLLGAGIVIIGVVIFSKLTKKYTIK